MNLFGKKNKSSMIKPQAPQRGAMFAGIRNKLKLAAPQLGIKPALPPKATAPQALPPINPPAQALPPINPTAPAQVVNPMEAKQKEAALAAANLNSPVDVGAAQVAPAPQPAVPAPTTVGPAQQMQDQKNQMFPPSPVAPAAPQITPGAGVTKSQADIDEEKKKLQAASGSPV